MCVKHAQRHNQVHLRWVHSEAQLGHALTKPNAKELDHFYQLGRSRWRIVSDDEMRSARKRKQTGMEILENQPRAPDLPAQRATFGKHGFWLRNGFPFPEGDQCKWNHLYTGFAVPRSSAAWWGQKGVPADPSRIARSLSHSPPCVQRPFSLGIPTIALAHSIHMRTYDICIFICMKNKPTVNFTAWQNRSWNGGFSRGILKQWP